METTTHKVADTEKALWLKAYLSCVFQASFRLFVSTMKRRGSAKVERLEKKKPTRSEHMEVGMSALFNPGTDLVVLRSFQRRRMRESTESHVSYACLIWHLFYTLAHLIRAATYLSGREENTRWLCWLFTTVIVYA